MEQIVLILLCPLYDDIQDDDDAIDRLQGRCRAKDHHECIPPDKHTILIMGKNTMRITFRGLNSFICSPTHPRQ